MNNLTRPQQRVLDFIQTEIREGRPAPTHREICKQFGYRSPRAAACHLEAIRRKGFLEIAPGKSRSLHPVSAFAKLRSRVVDIPLFGSIPAGVPQVREQDAEGCVSVDMESIGFKSTKPLRNAFALRVSGDSMIGKEHLRRRPRHPRIWTRTAQRPDRRRLH
jgi:repressor LexA